MDLRLTDLPDTPTIKDIYKHLEKNPETATVTTKTLQNWFRDGKIPPINEKRRTQNFRRSDVATVLKNHLRKLTLDKDELTRQANALKQAREDYYAEDDNYHESLQPHEPVSFEHKFEEEKLKILKRDLTDSEIGELENRFNIQNIHNIAGKIPTFVERDLLSTFEQLRSNRYLQANSLAEINKQSVAIASQVEVELHQKSIEFLLLQLLETVSQSRLKFNQNSLQDDLKIKVANEYAGVIYPEMDIDERNAIDRLQDFRNYFEKKN